MKIVVANKTRAQRRSIWAKMIAGTLQCRWAKIAARVKGKFSSQFVCGAWVDNGLVTFGTFPTLDALQTWAKARGLSPEHGTIKESA